MGGSETSAAGQVKDWEPAGRFWNRLEEGSWRIERGLLDRFTRYGGPVRLASRVWAHVF
jgi:predicted NUDIX family NTP pyrophosphohydrolase